MKHGFKIAQAFEHLLPITDDPFAGIPDALLEELSRPAQQLFDYERETGRESRRHSSEPR
jgi:hypothetical protein